MADPTNASIVEHFRTLEDPRIERTKKHLLLGRLLGIGRDRISEVFAHHAVKCLAAGHGVRLIEIPEQLIERAVFHHQHHQVIKGRQILPLMGDAEQGTRLRPMARVLTPCAKGYRRPGQPHKLPA